MYNLIRALAAIGVTTSAFLAFQTSGQVLREYPVAPQYSDDGDLLLPNDYEGWVFVGSNLGLAYRPDLAVTTAAESARADRRLFHNIYIHPAAYAHFRSTKQFPDPTILVMERFAAADREPQGIVSAGVFNGARVGLEIAVKNSRRPDRKTTIWAYYDFTDPSDGSKTKPKAAAFEDSDCESCHREHAGRDNVWVQFYPALRKFLP